MPQYNYTGKNIHGMEVAGQEKASNIDKLERELLDKGIFLDTCNPTISIISQFYLSMFKKSEITKATQQIHILLESGISIIETMELVEEQTKDSALQSIINNISMQIKAGQSIESAFNQFPKIFDSMYISILSSGEVSGELSAAFARIASFREKKEEIGKKITSALTYPLLVLLTAFFVMLALVVYVVPVFSSMYENFGSELPQLTRLVIEFSEFLQDSFWYILTSFFVFIILLVAFISTEKFKILFDQILVTIPLVRSLTIRILSARFCRTFGGLLKSGVDFIFAFNISIKSIGNLYLIRKLERTVPFLTQGKELTETLDTISIFPKPMLRMIASGEKTGRLGEMLLKSAEYYEKETESEIKTITTLIEPVIIIVLGIFVTFILVAMYLPLFELVGSI